MSASSMRIYSRDEYEDMYWMCIGCVLDMSMRICIGMSMRMCIYESMSMRMCIYESISMCIYESTIHEVVFQMYNITT